MLHKAFCKNTVKKKIHCEKDFLQWKYFRDENNPAYAG